ncbi:MAG: hypothetical protein PHU25_16640, partial [Deltaproteobacteria bacterium]|nr:hypothetical protein [Deltaproteobacteria bacterium]
LESVALISGLVTDFSPLGNNPLLKYLDASGGVLADTSSLAGLTGLEELNISSNHELQDISDLSGLTSLAKLAMRDTPIADISALSTLAELRDVDMSSSLVSDLSPLSTLTNLDTLDISKTKVGDVNALAGMANLKTLIMNGNVIYNIEAISQDEVLESIDFQFTLVDDIAPLATLTKLTWVNGTESNIADLSSLVDASWPNLVEIDLVNTLVADLGPLVANIDTFHNNVEINLWGAPLDCSAQAANIKTLRDRGVALYCDCGECL